MNLIDFLILVMPSAVICISFPRVLTLLRSKFTAQRWRLTGSTRELSQQKFSGSNAYPELTSLSN